MIEQLWQHIFDRVTAAEAKYVGTDAGGWVDVEFSVCGSFFFSFSFLSEEGS